MKRLLFVGDVVGKALQIFVQTGKMAISLITVVNGRKLSSGQRYNPLFGHDNKFGAICARASLPQESQQYFDGDYIVHKLSRRRYLEGRVRACRACQWLLQL